MLDLASREAEVSNILSSIVLPGTSVSLVQASFVRNTRVIENDIYVRLFYGADQYFLINAVKSSLSSLPWAKRIVVDTRTILGVKRTLAIGSGKGGVGKTSVTVGMALTLRDEGYKVGILDADVYGPNISTALGAETISVETSTRDDESIVFVPPEIDGLKVMSVGMLAEQGQSLAWRGPILTRLLKQFLFDVDWGNLDFLLIDLPPGTGDAQITLLQECPLVGVFLVGIPGMSSQADLSRTVAMYKQFSLPIVGYVENFSSIHCPHCGESFDFLLDKLPSDAKSMYDLNISPLVRLSIVPDLLSRGENASNKSLNTINPQPFSILSKKCQALL